VAAYQDLDTRRKNTLAPPVVQARFCGKRKPLKYQGYSAFTGVLSLGFGLFLAYRAGFVNGLFTTRPQWFPR